MTARVMALAAALLCVSCGAASTPIVEHGVATVEDGHRQLPSFRGFHGFDPKPLLETLDVPGVWLLGGDDRSIPAATTVAVLDQLIASGRPFAHQVFPGFGHDLSRAPIWTEIDRWLARTLR